MSNSIKDLARLENPIKELKDTVEKVEESFDYDIGDISFNTIEKQLADLKSKGKSFTKKKKVYNKNKRKMIKKSKKINR